MSENNPTLPLQTDADIERLFEQKIAPQLGALETERRAVLENKRKRWRIGGIATLVTAVATLSLCMAMNWSPWLTLIPVGLGGGITWIWASLASDDYEDRLRQAFMTPICKELGDLYYAHEDDTDPREALKEIPIRTFRDTHLIPSHDKAHLEDILEGKYRDCRFTLVEARLTSKSRDSDGTTTTVFKGLLFRLEVPSPIKGQVVIMRDYGTWINKMRAWWRDGVQVTIPHAEFEGKYQIHATSQELGLNVVTPSFVENFLALSKVFGTDKLRAAFIGRYYYMSADKTKPFLEGFSADTPPSELMGLFKNIVQQVKLVQRVIDELHKG